MFKIFTLKRDYEVLKKDRDAKADHILFLQKKIEEGDMTSFQQECKIKELEEACNQFAVRTATAEKEAIEAKQNFKTQEYYNGQLQQQMERKSCDGCVHSENYRKCASCARYPKLKDKWEAKE